MSLNDIITLGISLLAFVLSLISFVLTVLWPRIKVLYGENILLAYTSDSHLFMLSDFVFFNTGAQSGAVVELEGTLSRRGIGSQPIIVLSWTDFFGKEFPQEKKGIWDVPKSPLPSLSLPKGEGAICDIDEKFSANPVNGTGSMTVPIATSSGFGPQLSLSYDSGAGNRPFGFGWNLSLPSIAWKMDKGLPHYDDVEESDVFILSGSEDLVPLLVEEDGQWRRKQEHQALDDGVTYSISYYRPRIIGLFARIERWTNLRTGRIHWTFLTKARRTYGYRRV
jgi:Salmonella virulence plasmid 65kDa B protein